MPIKFVEIRGIKSLPVGNDRWRGTRYRIFTSAPGADGWQEVVSTLDVFKAALCERAWKTGKLVRMGTKDSRFGLELVTVDLADALAN